MMTRFFPFIGWFKNYNFGDLRTDAISGLTVALVLIPQSMAYAQLAGLPSYYGLYASFLPPMVAALFGSSRQLATGPVAVVSLMTAASLETLATAGSEGYIAYAILLALMVGAFQFSLGVLRLGLIVNFLSHPVVNGFTNAAALIIASSQLSKMFGVYVDKAPHHYQTIIAVVKAAVHYIHWPTLFMGVLAFAIMYGLKRIAPKIPNVLVAVAVATVISVGIGFEHNAVVPILALDSPKAREMIRQYNQAAKAILPLENARAEVNKALFKAKSAGDMLGIVNAEHEANVILIKTERMKDRAHKLREELRALHFVGGPLAGGSLRFHLAGEYPDKTSGDGRTWRIKVGNSPLQTDRLLMIGGGAVVGVIPRGLPALTMPRLDFKVIFRLLPFAAIISLLGFMEAISIAKAMAAKTGQRLDPNQELIGQGLANICGAIAKSYPTSGSFSRSAVNLQSGAISGLSSVITSLAVVIVLLFFTPLLYHLPQSVLAAIIMMAVIGLVNISGFIHAWRTKWYDGAISIISFVFTLAFAPHLDKGIMIGVALSLLVFLYKSMRPGVAALSRAGDYSFRCVNTHGLQECRYIAMVRFDGPLFFANASYLEDKMMDIMLNKEELKHIILVSNGINDIDASGEETLSLLVDRIRSAGFDISLSGVNESVMEVFKRTHFPEKIGVDHIYPTMESAISAIQKQTHSDAEKETCPLSVKETCPLSIYEAK